jgi:hypothetical protein
MEHHLWHVACLCLQLSEVSHEIKTFLCKDTHILLRQTFTWVQEWVDNCVIFSYLHDLMYSQLTIYICKAGSKCCNCNNWTSIMQNSWLYFVIVQNGEHCWWGQSILSSYFAIWWATNSTQTNYSKFRIQVYALPLFAVILTAQFFTLNSTKQNLK